jgi:hypothetical protein
MGKAGTRFAAIVALGLLGACTRWVDDPLAVHGIYPGLAPMPAYEGELPTVLFAAEDTPANQGLLYTAMYEAEVASQYAGRAAAAGDPALARSALGEVLYALDPELAPPWEAKAAGIVPGWAGGGYGVWRAATNLAAEVEREAAAGEPSPALVEAAPLVLTCAENTLDRAERVVALSREALDGAITEPLLEAIRDVATELNQGASAALEPDDPACGLEEAELYLDAVAPEGEGG